MATYYVRNDGSNGNTGTGQGTGQAWQTITYALTAMTLTAGVNTLYIAPGVYRESPILTVTPTATNTLLITGDTTASQFIGIVANQVRVTGATGDITANVQNSLGISRIDLGSKSYVTIQNLYIEHNGAFSGGVPNAAIMSSGDFITIRRNVIASFYLGGGVGSAIQVNPPNTTGNTILIQDNIIVGCAFGIQVKLLPVASGVSGVVITNCRISTNGWQNGYGIYVVAVSGTNIASVSISNCTITQFSQTGIAFQNGNVTDKHLVQNCIIALGGTGINSITSNQVTQRNNLIYATSNLGGVATDTSTVNSDFLGIDFGQSLLQGFASLAPFATSINSRNTSFGNLTSAPATDMYGVTWTGANPDLGTATLRSVSNIGFYLPTERNASAITIAPGSTSQSIELYLGATGLAFNTSGLAATFNRTRSLAVPITLVSLSLMTDGWVSGGFKEVNASTMPGVYRLDLPNAAIAAGADDVTVVVKGAAGTNGAVMTIKLQSVANEILSADIGGGANAGTLNERTVRSALRAMRNKVSVGTGTMIVYKEDDSTEAWTGSLSNTADVTVDPV